MSNRKRIIWEWYAKLRAEVYEPLQHNGIDSLEKEFSHFLITEKAYYDESYWILYPRAWKAKLRALRYTNRIKAIHPRLLTDLADWKIQQTAPELHEVKFDEQNSILFVDGLKVEINKQNRNNNGHLLLFPSEWVF